jgi:hypothetical protein
LTSLSLLLLFKFYNEKKRKDDAERYGGRKDGEIEREMKERKMIKKERTDTVCSLKV